MNKNYYKVLGITQNATQSEIKKAYFAKAKMYHPDICKDKDAEEKFKAISAAYENLNDDKLRKNYDEFIKNNSNKNYDENNFNDTSSFQEKNYNSLQQMFFFKSKDISFFSDFINNNFKTERDIIDAYSYFWLSFWSGGKGTIDMLQNKTATKIFKAFCANKFIKEMKESLAKEVKSDNQKTNEVNQLKKSLDKMYQSISNDKLNSQSTYNWMIRTIKEDNIFDDENAMYYFLLASNSVYILIEKFETIFVAGSPIRAKAHYSNQAKVRRGGGLLSGIVGFVLFILIFRFLII